MGWLDERIWCHPKVVNVPKESRWEYVAALAYSSGFSTGGHLSASQLRIIECTEKDRKVLVKVGLWDDAGEGGIYIHDWHDHNGKRDARKASDRERKRQARASVSAGQSADKHADTTRTNAGTESGAARVDRVTSDGVTEEVQSQVQSLAVNAPSFGNTPSGSQHANGAAANGTANPDLTIRETIRVELARISDLPPELLEDAS